MRQRVTYQIGDRVQAYDGRIGTVIYTYIDANGAFPNDQRVWMKCSDGSIRDAVAEYFQAMTLIRPASTQ